MNHIDMDSAILNARFRDGGEVVNGDDSMPIKLLCKEPEPGTQEDAYGMVQAIAAWVAIVVGASLCLWVAVTIWPVLAYAVTTF